MRFFRLCIPLLALTGLAQEHKPEPAHAEPDPDTPVATYWDGKKLTYGEMKRYLEVLPPQMQQAALRDRKGFILQLGLMRKLSELGLKAGLDQKSPTKESLEFNRMYILMTAELTEYMNNILLEPAELKKAYDENRDKYAEVKVKVIYVPFTAKPEPGSKQLTEEQAKEKITKILAEARGGADFVKLVKQHSGDQTSVAKDGDFGTIRRTDKIPEAIHKAVFSLKTGEISEPVRQPNGYYLFRAEDLSVRPYDEVRNELFNEIKEARYKAWLDENNRSVVAKYENEAILNSASPAASAPAR